MVIRINNDIMRDVEDLFGVAEGELYGKEFIRSFQSLCLVGDWATAFATSLCNSVVFLPSNSQEDVGEYYGTIDVDFITSLRDLCDHILEQTEAE